MRIYSMTKPITSVAFMMLVEEGQVALDDPVHRFIPSWRDLGVYVAGVAGAFQTAGRRRAPMRSIDLLRHTSGLTYGFQARTNGRRRLPRAAASTSPSRPRAWRAWCRRWRQLPLEFSPGSGLELLGLDRRAGLPGRQDLGPALRRVPAQPHLRAAGHGRHRLPRAAPTRRRALPPATSTAATASWCSTGTDPRASWQPPDAPSGGGGLVSTAADYMRFCECCASGGELDGVRAARPEDAAADARQPPARRQRPGRSVGLDVLRGQLQGRRLRPRLRGDHRRRARPRWPARRANTGGAARRRPRSGSTRWRTSASSS